MRFLATLAVLAAIGWSGYWYLATHGIERGLDSWLVQRQSEGWQAEARVGTEGFPSTFQTRIDDIALADPDTGLAWEAPFLTLRANAWSPTHMTAIFPQEQTIASPDERITIRTEKMEANLALAPGPALRLISSDAVLDRVALTSNRGWTADLASGRLTTNPAGDRPNAHHVRFEARDLRPSKAALRRLNLMGNLPETLEEVVLETRLDFDAAWDRSAIEDRRPQITSVDLDRLTARWGDMVFEAAGQLQVDGNGTPSGRITVRAVNWRDMVDIARRARAFPEALAPTITRALEVLARSSGNPTTIDAPLTFQNGRVSFGPIPLGRAPDFTIR